MSQDARPLGSTSVPRRSAGSATPWPVTAQFDSPAHDSSFFLSPRASIALASPRRSLAVGVAAVVPTLARPTDGDAVDNAAFLMGPAEAAQRIMAHRDELLLPAHSWTQMLSLRTSVPAASPGTTPLPAAVPQGEESSLLSADSSALLVSPVPLARTHPLTAPAAGQAGHTSPPLPPRTAGSGGDAARGHRVITDISVPVQSPPQRGRRAPHPTPVRTSGASDGGAGQLAGPTPGRGQAPQVASADMTPFDTRTGFRAPNPTPARVPTRVGPSLRQETPGRMTVADTPSVGGGFRAPNPTPARAATTSNMQPQPHYAVDTPFDARGGYRAPNPTPAREAAETPFDARGGHRAPNPTPVHGNQPSKRAHRAASSTHAIVDTAPDGSDTFKAPADLTEESFDTPADVADMTDAAPPAAAAGEEPAVGARHWLRALFSQSSASPVRDALRVPLASPQQPSAPVEAASTARAAIDAAPAEAAAPVDAAGEEESFQSALYLKSRGKKAAGRAKRSTGAAATVADASAHGDAAEAPAGAPAGAAVDGAAADASVDRSGLPPSQVPGSSSVARGSASRTAAPIAAAPPRQSVGARALRWVFGGAGNEEQVAPDAEAEAARPVPAESAAQDTSSQRPFEGSSVRADESAIVGFSPVPTQPTPPPPPTDDDDDDDVSHELPLPARRGASRSSGRRNRSSTQSAPDVPSALKVVPNPTESAGNEIAAPPASVQVSMAKAAAALMMLRARVAARAAEPAPTAAIPEAAAAREAGRRRARSPTPEVLPGHTADSDSEHLAHVPDVPEWGSVAARASPSRRSVSRADLRPPPLARDARTATTAAAVAPPAASAANRSAAPPPATPRRGGGGAGRSTTSDMGSPTGGASVGAASPLTPSRRARVHIQHGHHDLELMTRFELEEELARRGRPLVVAEGEHAPTLEVVRAILFVVREEAGVNPFNGSSEWHPQRSAVNAAPSQSQRFEEELYDRVFARIGPDGLVSPHGRRPRSSRNRSMAASSGAAGATVAPGVRRGGIRRM